MGNSGQLDWRPSGDATACRRIRGQGVSAIRLRYGSLSVCYRDGMITDMEREAVLGKLNVTRQLLLDTVAGISEEQASWSPGPGRWSILQYVEHLAISDDGLIALIQRALESPAQPETSEERKAREEKIRQTAVPRGVNQAPERLRPVGRFATLVEAVDAFLAARARTLEFGKTTTADLRSHFSTHNVFGPLDAYQWLMANGRHVESHAGHIREILAMEGLPPR
jgi:DinB superfamily